MDAGIVSFRAQPWTIGSSFRSAFEYSLNFRDGRSTTSVKYCKTDSTLLRSVLEVYRSVVKVEGGILRMWVPPFTSIGLAYHIFSPSRRVYCRFVSLVCL